MVERLENRLALSASGLLQISDLPALNSNPGVPVDIYIDLNGHFQADWGIYPDITTSVYDEDGDPTTFSESELADIYASFDTIAEDFAPFDVNVTTVEPTVLAEGVPEDLAKA